VLLFPYDSNGFQLDITEEWQGEVSHHYGIQLLATDAAQQPDLNVILYGNRLFQQYVVNACVKMEQQRLNYVQFNVALHDECRFCFLCFDVTFLQDKKVYQSCFLTILD